MPITGNIKSSTIAKQEVDYRALPSLNYSMLKVYDEDPAVFFDVFKLGKTRREKPSVSKVLGDITHFFLLDCRGDITTFESRVDEKFACAETEIGSGQVFVLAEQLYNVTEDNTNEEGKCTMDMADMFEEAFRRITTIRENVKGIPLQKYYKGKTVDQAWDDFEKNGSDYYQKKMKNIGKTIVSPSQLEKGKTIGISTLRDPFTAHCFEGLVSTSFPIEWLYDEGECSNTPCKSEIDKFKVVHRDQRIYPFDLKCIYDNESFEYGWYLKYRYYLQQAFYWKALKYYFTHIETDYADYEIMPLQFIVADTSLNNRRPLIYKCSEEDLLAGLNGFNLGHRHYKGVRELMDEICWAESHNIWNLSKQAYDNKGIMNLNFRYEYTDVQL